MLPGTTDIFVRPRLLPSERIAATSRPSPGWKNKNNVVEAALFQDAPLRRIAATALQDSTTVAKRTGALCSLQVMVMTKKVNNCLGLWLHQVKKT